MRISVANFPLLLYCFGNFLVSSPLLSSPLPSASALGEEREGSREEKRGQ